jgi:hypothetical protein
VQRAEVRGKTELVDLEQSAGHPQALPRLLDEPDERHNELHSEALSGHQYQSVAIISIRRSDQDIHGIRLLVLMNDDLLRWHRDRLGHVSEPRELAVRQAPKDVDGPDEGGNHAQFVQANQEQSSALRLRKMSTDLMREAIMPN